jgi:CubicO group peptidase (beta-lactamase class C family)
MAAALRRFALTCVLLAGCGSTHIADVTILDTPAPDPTTQWTRARPAEVGIDEAAIHALVQRIRDRYTSVQSLLIVRHGYLVTEEYFHANDADVLHTLQSVTKSITALAAGVAIGHGAMSVQDSVLPRFADYIDAANADARKRSLVVEDLLTMRTGLDWSEVNYDVSPLKQLNQCACDWIRFVLDWPMRLQPGQQWEYNSGGVILLGDFISRALGAPLTPWLDENLFAPIGIDTVRWFYGAGAIPHTGGGLWMRATDLARIGLLVLHGGAWEDRQLVDPDWLAEATRPHTTTSARWGGRSWSYGYLFWLTSLSGAATPAGDDIVVTAAGALGQWLFVVPRYDLVVVVNGNASTDAEYTTPVSFLFSDILPAVRH